MKKLLSVLLTLAMLCGVFSVFSITSSAAENVVYIGNVELQSGYVLLSGETEPKQLSDVLQDYTYEELKNEGFAFLFGDDLLLSNFEYNGQGYGDVEKRKAAIRGKNLDLQLSGENRIVCSTVNAVGIYVEGYFHVANGASTRLDEPVGSIEINADFGIMVMDDADSGYNPRYTQSNVDVTLNASAIGLAVGSELRGAFIQLYSGSLTINGDEAQSGIAIAAPEGESRSFVCNVADMVLSGCDYGIYAKDITFSGGSYISYAADCGLYAEGGDVELSEAYIDITVTAAAGNSIRSSMTKVDLKTMYVDFGTGADDMYVAYPRSFAVVGGVYLYDGDYLATGDYESSTDKPAIGGYAYYTVNSQGIGVLELYDFEVSESVSFTWGRSGQFEGENACIYSTNNLNLVLKGENAITPEQYDYAIAIYGSLTVEGDGSLDIGDDEHYSGILLLGDHVTGDIAFTMESGSLNVYSEYSISVYCLDYNNDATLTLNGGDLFARSLEAYASDNAEGIIEINGGKLEISGIGGTYSYGLGGTGYYQNGGIVTIEAIAGEYSIIHIYNPEDEFGGNFEIYGGELSIKEIDGDPCLTTNCQFPVLGHGMAVVEGDWDSAYIKIAKESGGPDIPPVTEGKIGDVNNDGSINQYDYILVKRHYFETRTLTADEFTRADVNGDTKVDQFDYILIARHYFGTYTIG